MVAVIRRHHAVHGRGGEFFDLLLLGDAHGFAVHHLPFVWIQHAIAVAVKAAQQRGFIRLPDAELRGDFVHDIPSPLGGGVGGKIAQHIQRVAGHDALFSEAGIAFMPDLAMGGDDFRTVWKDHRLAGAVLDADAGLAFFVLVGDIDGLRDQGGDQVIAVAAAAPACDLPAIPQAGRAGDAADQAHVFDLIRLAEQLDIALRRAGDAAGGDVFDNAREALPMLPHPEPGHAGGRTVGDAEVKLADQRKIARHIPQQPERGEEEQARGKRQRVGAMHGLAR